MIRNNIKAIRKLLDCPEEHEDETNDLSELLEVGMPGSWTPTSFVGLGEETRTIFLCSELIKETGAPIVSQILSLADTSQTLPIIFMINSPGGSVQELMAIWDALRSVPNPIITVAFGEVASAGFILTQAGYLRIAYPNTNFFWHEPVLHAIIDTPGGGTSLLDQYKELSKTIRKMMMSRSGMSKKEWKTKFAGNSSLYFSASQAVELGFIDEIENPTAKPTFKNSAELMKFLEKQLVKVEEVEEN